MSFSFVPEFCFNSFDEVTAEFLSSNGIKGVVLDVDNTLEPYENPEPSQKVLDWLLSLSEAGISAAIVSNNGRERIERFNKSLHLPAYYKAKKPFKKNILLALSDMGVEKQNAALLGDQVFTDVWAAHNAGIKAILVPPIKDKRDILTRTKRLLEVPVLKSYKRKHKTEKTREE